MRKYLNLRANIALGLIFAFLVNSLGPAPSAQAGEFTLPVPGTMVALSPEFNPPILKGIKVHPDNPFRFDFILDQGDAANGDIKLRRGFVSPLQAESIKLIKYFLASLTIPEKDLWVNLSPYEKDRIIPQSFGLTEMGRDLLAEDYILKQITASLIYPEGEVGKKFWKRIYEVAAKKFGTTNIPVSTFNKVWIVPEKAVVYENAKAGTAYVVEAKLKVMLEQDYLVLSHSERPLRKPGSRREEKSDVHSMASDIIRQIIIPELTKEVNTGRNFAQLRQVYNSLILATWYKNKIKDSILARVYEDKKKVAGVEYGKPVILSEAKDLKMSKDALVASLPQNDVERIYQRYRQAFKKGAYNYIKEDQGLITQKPIPRKYFSGGVQLQFGKGINSVMIAIDTMPDSAMSTRDKENVVVSTSLRSEDSAMGYGIIPSIVSVSKNKNQAMITANGNKSKIERLNDVPQVNHFVARHMADILKYNNDHGDKTVFILPTGGTAEGIYTEFIKIVKDEDIGLAWLVTFNMDEYYVGRNYQGDWSKNPQSYRYYMEKHLLSHLRGLGLGWDDKDAHFLNGQAKDINQEVMRYEGLMKNLGKIDFILGGIGRDGHIAFNEPVIEIDSSLVHVPVQKLGDYNEFHLTSQGRPIDDLIREVIYTHWAYRRNHWGSQGKHIFLNELRDGLKQRLRKTFRNDVLKALIEKLMHQPLTIYLDLSEEEISRHAAVWQNMASRIAGRFHYLSLRVEFLSSAALRNPRSRHVQLAVPTILDNARFFDDVLQIPLEALTIGVGTLMDAKEVMIAATGEKKANAVHSAVKMPVSSEVSASYLQDHPNSTFVVDTQAAARLDLLSSISDEAKGKINNLPDVRDQAMRAEVNRTMVGKDLAMKAENNTGGIDLSSDKALSVQNNGQSIKFHIDPAQLAQLQNVTGFEPVIINIQPMRDLKEFLYSP